MTTKKANDPCKAACLTPSAPGGIGVIQVIGRDAPAIVAAMIEARRPLDWDSCPADHLHLCRIRDGRELVDEGLVAVRTDSAGRRVVDLSVHGGPRVVQRVLLILKQAGVHIVEPGELGEHTWPQTSLIEREGLDLLPRVQTRPVAAWLIRTMHQLPAKLESLARRLRAGDVREAKAWLQAAAAWTPQLRYLLTGIRVTVLGAPNAGKSTLVNRLAGRETAITNPTPGTTRDWTEHRGAVDGLPFTFVDTAGLRETSEALEQEAIRRARQQIAPADLVLLLVDRSAPCSPEALSTRLGEEDAPPSGRPVLLVWNKTDLPPHPSHTPAGDPAQPPAVSISALSGTGLEALRRGLVEAVGLAGWQGRTGYPFTTRQAAGCQRALSALALTPPNPAAAADGLQEIFAG